MANKRYIGFSLPISFICCALIIASFACPAKSFASSYAVQANVPYPAPTIAATFDSGYDGSTAQNAAIVLTGSCQMIVPSTVVSIWRSGTSIGSTLCNSGLFSIQVILINGQNVLTARSASISGLYGPDSTTANISLQIPLSPSIPSNSSAGTSPTTNSQMNNFVNQGTLSNLSITTPQVFSALPDNNTVSLQIIVKGGTTPYTIMLNWGDGNTESHQANTAGAYIFAHTYNKAGNYQVQAQAKDVLGAYSIIYYQVVSYKAPSQPNGTSNSPSVKTYRSYAYNSASYYVIIMALILIVLAAYTGYRAGTRRALSNNRAATASKKKKK